MSKPSYRTPAKARNVGGIEWRAIFSAILFFLVVNIAVTQRLAAYFRYQPVLGEPVTILTRLPIYEPFHWAFWAIRFSTSPYPQVQSALRLAVVAVFAGLLFSVLLSVALIALRTRLQSKGSEDLHGSARFANSQEVRDSGTLDNRDGPYIGAWEDTPGHITYLRDDSAEHILAFAPTGSGKTAGLCVPTLLSESDSSMVIYDIKGELHRLTSGYRAQAGNVVLRFAPVDENGTKFNLFGELRLGTLRDVSDAQNLADMHCHVPGENSNEPHWDDIAASLVTGIILHESYKARQQDRQATGRDISLALSPLEMPFTDYLNEMLSYPHDKDNRYQWTLPDGRITQTHPVVREKAREMLNRVTKEGPNNEFSGALSTAKKRFTLYSDPLITRNTSASDFTIDQLVNHHKPVSLYLVVPLSDQERLTPLTRLVFTTIINRLTEAERATKANKHRLLLMLDEFPNLKRLEIISKSIPLIRGFGIKAFLIAQGIGQIEEAYGEHQSIVNNCNTRITYTPNDWKTAKTVSDMTGVTTVEQTSSSFSGSRYGWMKKQITTHVNYIQRPLLTPDEVTRLKPPKKEKKLITEPGDMLIFLSGHRPIYGKQMLFFFDPVFKKRSEMKELAHWPSLADSKNAINAMVESAA